MPSTDRRLSSLLIFPFVFFVSVSISQGVEQPTTTAPAKTEETGDDIAVSEAPEPTTPKEATQIPDQRRKRREKREAGPKKPGSSPLTGLIASATDRSKPYRVRGRAIDRLGRLGTKEALQTLIKIASSHDEVEYVRERALESLVKNPDELKAQQREVVEPLLTILNNQQEPAKVRAKAAEPLLKAAGEAAVKPLLTASEDKAPEVRAKAILALQSVRDPEGKLDHVALLGRLLNDEAQRNEWRSHAAKLLGFTGDLKAADPLIRAIEKRPLQAATPPAPTGPTGTGSDTAPSTPLAPKPDPLVDLTSVAQKRSNFRLFSVQALGKLKAKQAVPTLLEALKSDPDPLVRAESAEALEKIAGAEVEDAFIAALKDTIWETRLSAAVALKQVGGPKAVKPLIEILKDPERRVRLQAAEGLGRLGPAVASAAIEPLKEAAEREKVDYIRDRMLEALGKLEKPSALTPAEDQNTKERS